MKGEYESHETLRILAQSSSRRQEVVLGSTLCELCCAKYYWERLCASFVVRSSTGKYFVQAFVVRSSTVKYIVQAL